MSFEDEYAGRQKQSNNLRAFLPIMGLMLLVAFGAIAWIASEPLHDFVYEEFFQQEEATDGILPGDENSFARDEVQYFFAAGTFLLLLMLSGFTYALFAPKPTKLATEAELKKEREAKRREAVEKKRRRQTINKQMAAERERKEREAQRRK
jgi:hypothetical protein